MGRSGGLRNRYNQKIESYGIVVHENERSISVAGHYAVGNSNTLEQASGIIDHTKSLY